MNDKLTKSDIEKMEKEIEYRKLELRPKLLEDVKEMRAHGDLSENFEYHAAKRAKNINESRIRYLEKMIRTAEIIEDNSADDEIGINNIVTVKFEDDDATETYKLVTSVRGDTLNNYITIESPLGKAILGKKVGERAEVHVNESVSYFVEIVSFENCKDDSEDEIARF